MLRLFKRISSVTAALATVASVAAAQQGGTISGRVLTESGAPLTAASVSISSLGLGAYTNDQGVYTINVSAARMTGQAVELTARRVGYAPKTLQRVLRFQGFLALAEAERTAGAADPDLAQLAFAAGYADQAHLTRECTRLAGLPPAALLATGAGPGGERSPEFAPVAAAPGLAA